ncbi:hypothetical protein KIN20_020528 [Parelaphostrongylus tenuis]|uniref:Uncharacterized protein n=1 Tax=Parelaphostrongylus tenuis TaxID=148309 RepID=A0AAD5N3B3_PARTN|nr:hypothetical protein KIN20_020528 [Parelaphostrongylus tenuis]
MDVEMNGDIELHLEASNKNMRSTTLQRYHSGWEAQKKERPMSDEEKATRRLKYEVREERTKRSRFSTHITSFATPCLSKFQPEVAPSGALRSRQYPYRNKTLAIT